MRSEMTPPPPLVAAAARVGFDDPAGRAWRHDGQLRQHGGLLYRCPCPAGNGVVLLHPLVTDGGTYRVGQCRACRTFTWYATGQGEA